MSHLYQEPLNPQTFCFSSYFGTNVLQRSFSELVIYGKEKITEQKNLLDSERNRLSNSIKLYEDKSLETSCVEIETQIKSLDCEVDYTFLTSGYNNLAEKPLVPSCLPGCRNNESSKETLWFFLQEKYNGVLRTMVEETIDDSLRITACQIWEDDLREWEHIIDKFEASLSLPFFDKHESQLDFLKLPSSTPSLNKTPTRNTVTYGNTYLTEQTPLEYQITFKDRLLLNLVTKPPILVHRLPEEIRNIINISCESSGISVDIQDACSEIWEIIIALCGSHSKECLMNDNIRNFNKLKQSVHNTIRSLENLARRQLLYNLNITNEDISADEFFSHMKSFCSIDQSLDVNSSLSFYWKLVYFSYRCGSPECFFLLMKSMESSYINRNSKANTAEVDLIVLVIKCLVHRLLSTSRSAETSNDSVFKEVTMNFLEKSKECFVFFESIMDEKSLLSSLFHTLEDIPEEYKNKTLDLLTSMLQLQKSPTRLQNLLPVRYIY